MAAANVRDRPIEDIRFFEASARAGNDLANKKREDIIIDILNRIIPNRYFIHNQQWRLLKTELERYLYDTFQIDDWSAITAIKKAGRGHHSDIELRYARSNSILTYHIEWKFGASKITECPQFVSPAKPNKYMTEPYDVYHYDNFLEEICTTMEEEKPDKDTYLREINRPYPPCISSLQQKYYKGATGSSQCSGEAIDIARTAYCKQISKKSIRQFFEKVELNKETLNEYLRKSQKNKHYMLYSAGSLYHDIHTVEDYMIVSVEKKAPYFICTTKSGKTLKILLRWKNGNGIAYPAFQIK
tara:strand:- start:5873 stop:6772 length:900 start_codon:yes stop_codon:yes gene_type:complete